MSDKAKNILSYLIPICGIAFMITKENSKEVKFVGAQATTLWGIYFILNLINFFIYIPMYSTILNTVYLIVVIIGVIKVCQDTEVELPIIGKLAKSIFKKVIEIE